jgi:CubicO group peptidase (beta-lactamase class C family)
MTFVPERLPRAHAFLERGVADGAYAGAVALIALDSDVVAHWAVGDAQVEPESDRRSMTPDTIFDLASLTKAVGGATAALLLLEDGVWSLDDAVARFIPEFAQHGKRDVTLRHLLTHTAGFAGWVCTYAHATDPESALSYICALPLASLPGTTVVYSDIGMSIVGHLVRRVTGAGVDVLLRDRVWGPLGMTDTGYNPPVERRARIAATERGNRYEQAMVRNLGEPFDGFRTEVIVGEVNDGNTWYPLGGVSTHAGLFSTARDLFTFAQTLLEGGRGVLSQASIAEAIRDQTARLGQSRGLGWQLLQKGLRTREELATTAWARRVFPPSRYSLPGVRPYGDLFGPRTFGHTGFTGTSLAIDPDTGLIVILLTNRIHPDADNFLLEVYRPRFHNMVASAAQ